MVDPLTGAVSLMWNVQGIHIYAGGLAYDAATDTLYATGAEDSRTGTSRLFKINRFTGAVTGFGGMISNINITSGGLAISPLTGIMYATGGFTEAAPHQSTALFTINKSTGAATLVGFAGGNCCTGDFGIMLNGLGFRSDGSLLSLGSLDAASGALFAVSSSTGAATCLSGSVPYGGGPIHFGVDGGLVFAPAVPAPDSDTDGIVDSLDNCKLVDNPTQVDSDHDGYGNRCDADLNNNGFTNGADTTLFRQLLGAPPRPSGLACAGTLPCP
jgi:hypothetical protein